MSKLCIVFSVVFIVVSAAVAQDEPHRSASIDLGGGISFQASGTNGSDQSQSGFNVNAGIDLPLSNSVTFQANFMYNSMPFTPEMAQNITSADGSMLSASSVQITNFLAGLRVLFNSDPQQSSGYLTMGIGYMNMSINDLTYYNPYSYYQTVYRFKDASVETFAANIGLGFEVPMGSSAAFFMEAKYCIGFASVKAVPYVPALGGVKFNI